MNRRRNRHSGFALLLVIIVLGTSVLLAVSYMSGASVKLASTSNLLRSSRAKYLAESGIQHALFILQTDPESLENSYDNHLGPYHADETGDSYYIYAESDGGVPETYVLYSEGHCGGARQLKSMTVRCLGSPTVTFCSGVTVTGDAQASLPAGMTLTGDVLCWGDFSNQGSVSGDATSGGAISDPLGLIEGQKNEHAALGDPPEVNWEDYQNYLLFGVRYPATVLEGDYMGRQHPLAKGGAITPANPAGVVWLKPEPGKPVTLAEGVKFRGTLIIDGDLILGWEAVMLTPEDGFPAIVATGKIYVKQDTHAIIKGLVIADGGIVGLPGATDESKTKIFGGLVSKTIGYDPSLEGSHTLDFDAQKCTVYDVKKNGSTSLDLVSWNR